uniref:Uncharacterized protein n=1 Tax=Anguilla anguilla TaxID=7936 RepID=A0A0E9Q533_ANGAN
MILITILIERGAVGMQILFTHGF